MTTIAAPGTRLLASHALSATAMSMPWPVLLAQVWSVTGSDNWLGVAGAARMLPYVVLSAAAGLLADRIRRTAVLRWATAIRVGLLFSCGGALLAGLLGLAVVLAVATVAVGTPAYPAAVAAVPALVEQRHRGRLTDGLVTAEVTAFVVGPAVGGVLLGVGAGAWTVLLSGGVAALAWPLLLGLDSGPTTEPVAVAAERRRLRTVLASPGVPAAIGLMAAINFAESAASVGLLGLSHGPWGAGDRSFGIATAALGFGSLAAPLLGLVIRRRASLLLTGAGFAGAGLAPGVAVGATPLVLAGAGGTVVECACTDVLQRSVPDRVRAFSLGLADSAMVSAALLGVLVAPTLVGLAGPVAVFVGLGAVVATSSLVRTAGPRRLDQGAAVRDGSVV